MSCASSRAKMCRATTSSARSSRTITCSPRQSPLRRRADRLDRGDIACGGARGEEAGQGRRSSRCRRSSTSTMRSRRREFLGPQRDMATGDVDAGLRRGRAHARGRADHRRAGAFLPRIAGRDRLSRRAADDDRPFVDAAHDRSAGRRRRSVRPAVSTASSCICKRMGGGFGGKETQAAQPAAMAALASRGSPAGRRGCVLDRDDDMAITGKRHPFKAWYKVGFTSDGRITALHGRSLLQRRLLDRSCRRRCSSGRCCTPTTPTICRTPRITGRVCNTNLPVEHGVSRLRRAAGRGGDRERHRRDRARARPRRARRPPATNCYGGRRPRHDAVRPDRPKNNVLPALVDAAARDVATTTAAAPRSTRRTNSRRRRRSAAWR